MKFYRKKADTCITMYGTEITGFQRGKNCKHSFIWASYGTGELTLNVALSRIIQEHNDVILLMKQSDYALCW